MKRLSSCTHATPIHENGRRRNVSYRNCIFLGETGSFLALDQEGIADIIRPSHGALGSHRRSCQGDNDEPATVHSFRATENTPSFCKQRCGLFSLKDGKAFAVALHDGGLKIYDTETTTNFEFAKDPNSFGVSQAHPGRIGQNFSLQGWVARGPFRALENHTSTNFTQEIGRLGFVDMHGLTGCRVYGELDWGSSCFLSSHQVGWDIRESPNLNAVHVDKLRDSFAFRFFDERTNKHHSVASLHADSDGQTLRDVCYCSDYSVATATDVAIMLWDIRMLRNDNIAIQEPAFPDDLVHALDPSIRCKLAVSCEETQIFRLCCLASGNLLALTGSGYQVFDPIRNQLLTEDSDILSRLSLAAVDTNFGVLATYDLFKPFVDQSSYQTIQLYDVWNPQAQVLRKRKQDDSTNIVTSIIDHETETSTSLRSLSFNSRGDSLVGSSEDGNVFVFN